MKKDPRIDDYVADAAAFAKPILTRLRRSVHKACPQVEETIKWNMPFFMHHGNLCFMAEFKAHCDFGFWNRAMLPLVRKSGGPAMNAHKRFGKFTSQDELPSDAVLVKLIKSAAGLNEAAKPSRKAKSS